MADHHPTERDVLSDIARIAAGFGVLAAAALGAVAARKRGLRPDVRRKPPEAGIAAPAIPPRGPLPMQGGAAAPLNFERR